MAKKEKVDTEKYPKKPPKHPKKGGRFGREI
jgi:hypothetical protein